MSIAQTGLELSEDRTQVVTYHGDDAEVSIPDFVLTLSDGLFAHCTALKTVKLPSGVVDIPARLFEGCTSLERVRLPMAVHTVGEGCFEGCTSLASVPTAPGMTEIAQNMFKGCTAIVSFIVPEGIKTIRRGAFFGCARLATLVLSASVTEIEDGAFDGCTALRHIRVADENSAYYIEENDGLLRRKSDGEIILPLDGEMAQSAKAGLLHEEEEIDLTPDVDEDGDEEESWSEGGQESKEAIDNNFIGDDEELTDALEGRETTEGLAAAEGNETANADHEGEEKETMDNTQENEMPSGPSIADILSQNIMNRGAPPARNEAAHQEAAKPIEPQMTQPPAEKAVTDTVRSPMETKVNEAEGAKIEGVEAVHTTAAAGADEIERIALEQDILTQNMTDGAKIAAAGKDEINRIAMEHDILSQNVTDGAKVAAAKSDELNRIVMEHDILSQNTSTEGSGAGAAMDELVLLSKESEILRDNTKVSNHIVFTPSEAATKVEGEEVDADVPILVQKEEDEGEEAQSKPTVTVVKAETSKSAEERVDTMLSRVKGAAQKYECIETGATGNEALYVFAEKLITNATGDGKFSAALVRCSKYLAETHSLGKIHLFCGLPFDHMEFMQMFRQFILGKNAVYACDADDTKHLSASARAFAESANIKLNRAAMAEQLERSSTKGGLSFRLILKDNYKE